MARAFVAMGRSLCAVAFVCAVPAMAEQLRPQTRPAALAAQIAADTADAAAIPDPTQIAVIAPVMPMSDLSTAEDPIDASELPASFEAPIIGPETNLPLPRFVSLKTDEGNVRRGPSMSHRIDWVFLRRGMPLQVTAEYGHWRRVVDREGIGGWINYALISGHRTVIVDASGLVIRERADLTSPSVAELEQGVIASIEGCTLDYCEISAGGYDGWAPKSALWGVTGDEIIN